MLSSLSRIFDFSNSSIATSAIHPRKCFEMAKDFNESYSRFLKAGREWKNEKS